MRLKFALGAVLVELGNSSDYEYSDGRNSEAKQTDHLGEICQGQNAPIDV